MILRMKASEPRRRAGRLVSGGAIKEAAAALFLERGYQATSMDDIAAAAQVSKQTIYTHFANKEQLFADLVLDNAGRVDTFVAAIGQAAESDAGQEAALGRLAREYLRLVVRPDVLRLRRLVIGEAGRFPDLARTYYERVPARVLAALAGLFEKMDKGGRLRVDDPTMAAHHFAWLILGRPLDHGMFGTADSSAGDLDRIAAAGVRVFLAAYGAQRPA